MSDAVYDIKTPKFPLSDGRVLMDDGHVASGIAPESERSLVNENTGAAVAPATRSPWMPNFKKKKKSPALMIRREKEFEVLSAVPFHFGLDAGGNGTGTPGGYAEPNQSLINSGPVTCARERRWGYFLHFYKHGFLEREDYNFLSWTVYSAHGIYPLTPHFHGVTYGVRWPFFYPTTLEDYLNSRIFEWSPEELKAEKQKVIDLFPLTGDESSGTYSGTYVDPTISGWWGDPDGYYFMRELFYKNPGAPGVAGNYEMRECDWYGVSLIRKRQYTELVGGTEAELYSEYERDLDSFLPFPEGRTFNFHPYYTFSYANDTYHDRYEKTLDISVNATLTRSERYDLFPWKYSVVLSIDAGGLSVYPLELYFDWWLPAKYSIEAIVRVYHNPNSPPTMVELSGGVGSADFTKTFLVDGNFEPYAAVAINLPAEPDVRFDWGEFV